VAHLLEAGPQRLAEQRVIFHQQHPHRADPDRPR
jgi:hypothetical protein